MYTELTKVPEMRILDADGQPRDRIIGHEQEYSLTYYLRQDHDQSDFTQDIIRNAFGPRRDNHNGSLSFETDGSRAYIDGHHPEECTPEDTDHLRAAKRLLHGHVKAQNRFTNYFNRNEYLRSEPLWLDNLRLGANTRNAGRASWGKHLNLLASRELAEQTYILPLATYRATRIIFTGAGSVGTDDEGKLRLELSEKAPFIEDIANGGTEHNRPLVNLRDESLADSGRFRRIHDAAGESGFAAVAIAVDSAAQDLLLRALEVGADFSDLYLEDPVLAIKQVSADPTLKRTVRLQDGRSIRAVQHQRELALRAIASAEAGDNMTDQSREWGQKWLQLLGDLATDPTTARRRVNWVIKHELIDRALSRPRYDGQPDVAIAWLESIGFHRLLPREAAGMQLLRKGFFDESPTAKELAEGLPLPPTRARVRGEALRRLGNRRGDFSADWFFVGRRHSAYLPLYDPYDSSEDRLEEFFDKLARRPH